MNYQEKYQKAKESNYSDEEIIDFLSHKDPTFNEKLTKAIEQGYSPEEIISFFNKSKTKEPNYVSDIAEQYPQGFAIGGLGSYGDILDLFGLQPNETSEVETGKYNREYDTLTKLEKGEIPSLGEFEELSEQEPIPRFSRFSSGKDVERIGEQIGLINEPKTAAGRYAKRIGRIHGASKSLGFQGLKAPIAAGAAGQTVEEAGGPPWMQAAAEIIASLKASKTPQTNISSNSKEVEDTIQKLRQAGYTEKDITLAKNALEERKLLKKYSTLTPEAENSINQGLKNSEDLLKEQIKKGIPGYAEGGLSYLEKQASNVYQTMEDLAQSIPIKNPKPVQEAIQKSIDYLEKYPLLKDQKEFIEFLKDGLAKSSNANNAEFYTGFYRNLGKAGNWSNPTQKEHILGLVKDGIKQTLSESGPEAAKFGKYFEKTNDTWKYWLKTRDLMQEFEKASKNDGIDFSKIKKMLNDSDFRTSANQVLGAPQVKNIDSIIDGSSAIESLIKQIPKNNQNSKMLTSLEAIRSIFTGDIRPLAALIGINAAKHLATDILINPEKQNRMLKLIAFAKRNSPQQAAIVAEELLKSSKDQNKEKPQSMLKFLK